MLRGEVGGVQQPPEDSPEQEDEPRREVCQAEGGQCWSGGQSGPHSHQGAEGGLEEALAPGVPRPG